IEQDLLQIVDRKYWIDFSPMLILHGRERCPPRKPDCDDCELTAICPKLLQPSCRGAISG
ncbi:MAG TPA: hypothetical protein PKC25_11355, partial [Candidatus Rifleibacterium sp.]|nr:hypothetical protein [Candidatus Rifleibacterium sp.]